MANSNGSFGLRPLSKQGGAANSTGMTQYSAYEIANGNTSKFYHGEPVIPLTNFTMGNWLFLLLQGLSTTRLTLLVVQSVIWAYFKDVSMSLVSLEKLRLVTTGLDPERIVTTP